MRSIIEFFKNLFIRGPSMHALARKLRRNWRFQVRMSEKKYLKDNGTLLYKLKMGMHITCKNGNVVSGQWGPGNYSEKYDQRLDSPNVTRDSVDAEVAIWDKDGTWHGHGHDNVIGWQTPEQVMAWILWASENEVEPRGLKDWEREEVENELLPPYASFIRGLGRAL